MGSYRLLNYSPTRRVWLVTSRLGTGKPTAFLQCTVLSLLFSVWRRLYLRFFPSFFCYFAGQFSSLFPLLPAFYEYLNSIFFKSLMSVLCENCDAAWLLMRVRIQLLYSNNRNSLSTFSLFGSVANIGGISPGAVSVACFDLYSPINPISPSPIYVPSSLWWRSQSSYLVWDRSTITKIAGGL